MGEFDRDLYRLREAGLALQLADRYRLVFVAILWTLLLALGHLGGFWDGAAQGAFIGSLPALWFGRPMRMQVRGRADWIRAEALLRRGHRDAGGRWVPRLPRWAYFDSQVVRYTDGRIIGPFVTLHRLQAMLVRAQDDASDRASGEDREDG